MMILGSALRYMVKNRDKFRRNGFFALLWSVLIIISIPVVGWIWGTLDEEANKGGGIIFAFFFIPASLIMLSVGCVFSLLSLDKWLITIALLLLATFAEFKGDIESVFGIPFIFFWIAIIALAIYWKFRLPKAEVKVVTRKVSQNDWP